MDNHTLVMVVVVAILLIWVVREADSPTRPIVITILSLALLFFLLNLIGFW